MWQYNRTSATIRVGGIRTRFEIEHLCIALSKAWEYSSGYDNANEACILSRVFATRSIEALMEHAILLPKVGRPLVCLVSNTSYQHMHRLVKMKSDFSKDYLNSINVHSRVMLTSKAREDTRPRGTAKFMANKFYSSLLTPSGL